MSQIAALILRGAIAAFAGLLFAGGTLTLAADRAAVQRPTLASVAAKPGPLTVPQVTGQAYVFAKGILQDNGFAWHVAGSVQGFAGNRVVDQQPSAGATVLDTGAPVVTLTLGRNSAYSELGTPDNNAPYPGTSVRLVASPLAQAAVPSTLAPRFPAAASSKPAGKRAATRTSKTSQALRSSSR